MNQLYFGNFKTRSRKNKITESSWKVTENHGLWGVLNQISSKKLLAQNRAGVAGSRTNNGDGKNKGKRIKYNTNEPINYGGMEIGLGGENIELINILVADYDNDGHEDIYVVNWQGNSNLYHNNGNNYWWSEYRNNGNNYEWSGYRNNGNNYEWSEYRNNGNNYEWSENQNNNEYRNNRKN